MKIVIATPLYPPEVGGPAYYAFNLEQALVAQGVKVRVISYRFERKLPPGLRHILFFLRRFFCCLFRLVEFVWIVIGAHFV